MMAERIRPCEIGLRSGSNVQTGRERLVTEPEPTR